MTRLSTTQPRGVALIAVLWLVSAMGLIITGVVQSVRSEVRTVGLQRQAIIATASADAAILLALQHLHAYKIEPKNVVQTIPVQFDGLTREVSVIPLNGLIDLNQASVSLLADMYRFAADMTPEAAQALAQATLDFRQMKTAKGQPQGFDAKEDLLRVPTVSYDLYAKVVSSITVDRKDASGRVNPLSAPPSVLKILASGDMARAAVFESRRNAEPAAVDTSFIKPEHIEMTSSRSLRLQAQIDLPGGGRAARAWDVYWGEDPRSGLPWRVLSTHQSLQAAIQPAG